MLWFRFVLPISASAAGVGFAYTPAPVQAHAAQVSCKRLLRTVLRRSGTYARMEVKHTFISRGFNVKSTDATA